MIITVCVILSAAYALLMLAYSIGWFRQADFILPSPDYIPVTQISVIIPARNEQFSIGNCIESVLAQKYPEELFEIIVVDDHSEDATAAVVNEYAAKNVRCISLAEYIGENNTLNSYKKAALAAGIAQAKGELIVTTDADCVAPNSWLLHIAANYEQRSPVMIVAPVMYSFKHRLLHIFQVIDFMSMQGITAAAHALGLGNMSNGANLAFSKAAYQEVGGYDGISQLASGDDYLLMMKMAKQFPGRIAYLRSVNAVVSTPPQPDIRSFLQQRIRWASKSGKYNDMRLTLILMLVYLYNLSFLILFIAGIGDNYLWHVGLMMLVVKIIAEYIFLFPVARFFRTTWILRYFPFLQPLHILYIIAAGFMGFMGGYSWKGRWVK